MRLVLARNACSSVFIHFQANFIEYELLPGKEIFKPKYKSLLHIDPKKHKPQPKDEFASEIHNAIFFYLPYLSSIHEKAMYRYVLDGMSALAWSFHIRVTCLPHKNGASR